MKVCNGGGAEFGKSYAKSLDALNDFREQKTSIRSPFLTFEQKTHKQSEYIAAIERLAHALDHRVRTKVDLESLGYSEEQLAQIKEHKDEMAIQNHDVVYTLPKRP